MVLSGPKRVSAIASLSNQFQGGGDNKPGLYPQVGRISWTSVGYGSSGIPLGRCCKRSIMTRLNFRRVTPPVGTTIRVSRFSPF